MPVGHSSWSTGQRGQTVVRQYARALVEPRATAQAMRIAVAPRCAASTSALPEILRAETRDVDDEAAAMRPSAVLPQVERLPDAEGEIALANRNVLGSARENRSRVGRHVVGALVVV